MTRDEFEALIQPHRARLSSVVQSAWDEYLEEPHEKRSKHSKRTRASMRNDFMLHHAIREFQNVPGTNLVWSRGYLHLDIGGLALIRFKKLTHGRPRNYPTKTAVKMNGTDIIEGLPPRARRLVAGYQPDKFDSGYRVLVSAPTEKSVEWLLELDAFGSDGQQMVPVAPRDITPPSRPTTKVRRRGEQKETKRDESLN